MIVRPAHGIVPESSATTTSVVAAYRFRSVRALKITKRFGCGATAHAVDALTIGRAVGIAVACVTASSARIERCQTVGANTETVSALGGEHTVTVYHTRLRAPRAYSRATDGTTISVVAAHTSVFVASVAECVRMIFTRSTVFGKTALAYGCMFAERFIRKKALHPRHVLAIFTRTCHSEPRVEAEISVGTK